MDMQRKFETLCRAHALVRTLRKRARHIHTLTLLMSDAMATDLLALCARATAPEHSVSELESILDSFLDFQIRHGLLVPTKLAN